MITSEQELMTEKTSSVPFPAVIGQEQARQVLYQTIANERLSHAYLFAGPEGVGRWALTIELARVLNCSENHRDSAFSECNCRSCKNIRTLQHPNLTFMFPMPSGDSKKAEEIAQKTFEEYRGLKSADPYTVLQFVGSGLIRINQIRELRNQMALAPDRRGVRVAIIQPANRMNPQAANALLKLLEEPPEKCCIILIANSVKALLPTIVSRCHVVRFTPLSKDLISGVLQKRLNISKEDADLTSRMAHGSFSHARGLTESDLQAQLTECLDYLRYAVVGNSVQVSVIIDEWSRLRSKQEIIEKLDYVGVWLKDALINKSFSSEEAERHQSTTGQKETISRMATRYNSDQLSSAWQEIEEAKIHLNSNVMVSLVLTGLALKIYRIFK